MNAWHPMKNPIVDGEIPVSIWYSKKTHTSNWDNIYWLVVDLYSSEKYDFVSWEDDIPNSRWKKKMFQSTNQFRLVFPPRCWWALGRSTRPWHKCFDDPPANASPPHTPGLAGSLVLRQAGKHMGSPKNTPTYNWNFFSRTGGWSYTLW